MLFLREGRESKAGAAYLLAGYEGIPADASKYYRQLNDFVISLDIPQSINS
jgi:hypothetical protein